jgi:hypothetical protein
MITEDFVPEAAAIELAKKLPGLAKHNYGTIDKLMQRIAKKHQITGDNLHKLFIKKYKKTPDNWIKDKLNEKQLTTENINKRVLVRKGKNNDLITIRSFYENISQQFYGKKHINLVTEWTNNLLPKINESQDQEIKSFHDMLKQYAKSSHVPIKIGSKLCVLQAIVDIYSNNILLKGFKNPKTIVDIVLDNDQIKQIEFDDGTVFPEKYEFSTTELGLDLIDTFFFKSSTDLEKMVSIISLAKPENYKLATKLLNESTSNLDIASEVEKFTKWAGKQLKLEKIPKVHLSYDTKEAQDQHHTGKHVEGSDYVWVYAKNRNLVDILRTVFHELTHVRQGELGMIKPGSSYPGSPIEAQADVMAGKYIKIYGASHHKIFQ